MKSTPQTLRPWHFICSCRKFVDEFYKKKIDDNTETNILISRLSGKVSNGLIQFEVLKEAEESRSQVRRLWLDSR